MTEEDEEEEGEELDINIDEAVKEFELPAPVQALLEEWQEGKMPLDEQIQLVQAMVNDKIEEKRPFRFKGKIGPLEFEFDFKEKKD